MPAAIQTVRDVLVAAAPVTALVSADRITAMIRPQQAITIPAITLQRISVVPQNHLRGDGNLDSNQVQLDIYTDSYAASFNIADACRTVLQNSGHVLQSEVDFFESEIDPELYRLVQTWIVWT